MEMSESKLDCAAANDDSEFKTPGSAAESRDDSRSCRTALDSAASSAEVNKEKLTLERLCAMQATFAAERDWNQFHTPRNLLLALVIALTPPSEKLSQRALMKSGSAFI